MLTIDNLKRHPQHREQVIAWLWKAFGNEKSRAFYASVVDSSLNGADLPLTFIALDKGQVVGTVGLWRCDLISRQDLTPWLAALYVDEAWRDKGLGRQLQTFVTEYSRQAGYDELYLWSTFSGYYDRHGWNLIGDALDYPDISVRLYHRKL